MLKTLTALALALTALTAVPASAASPYLEATATNHGTTGLKAGVQAGALTLEAGAESIFKNDRTYVASAGLQPRIAGPLSAYGQVGYLHTSGNDGYRLGTGLSLNLTRDLYARAGYQRDDYGNGNRSDGAAFGLGLRF